MLGAAHAQSGSHLFIADEARVHRAVFDVGETIYVDAMGLRPSATYDIELTEAESKSKPELLARLMSDRHGNLPPTAVLPHFGLIPHRGPHRRFRLHDEAELDLGGRAFSLRAIPTKSESKGSSEARFAIAGASRNPQVFPCDSGGRLVTGFVRGEADILVGLRNFLPGCLRIFAVTRRFGWRPGDPLEPARDASSQPVSLTVRIDREGLTTVRLLSREHVREGSYQFVARHFSPGWYDADNDRLLAGDVLSNRRISSLVVRLSGKLLGWAENGVVLAPEITGRPLAHRPYFEFLNNFPLGTDVYAALDPAGLPANVVTTKAAIYVIRHKAAAEWAASSQLADISGPGMTAAPKIVPIVQGCVNWNETLVWPNPQTAGKYDVVIDFGNNAADPNHFAADGALNSPPDMIDGYVRTGFVVTQDPSLPGPFAGSIGRHSYNNGAVQVPSTDTGPFPTDSLPLTAVVRYPAQFSGDDAPCAAGPFPLVVIMHGNSGMETSYLGYNYLLDHLASQGFIAVSIYAPVGVMIETRARAILQHISIMAQNNTNPGLFQGHVDLGRIGIAGHSRGGEAVVRAARINTAEALGWNLRAGVSMAPTDYHHYGDPGIPLLVIYGANDGDVSGAWPDRTCFNIYDEAARPRSFVFVYGGTHDRFNSEWTTIEAQVEFQADIAPSDIPQLISETAHQNVAKAYVTAFSRLHLLGNSEQGEYFSAGLKPSLTSGLEIHTSHQDSGPLVLDNFEQHNPAANTLGGAVTTASLAAPLGEDQLHNLDSHSPHVTTGGGIAWTSTAGDYISKLPLAQKDVSAYGALSFRVTQKYGSADNAPHAAQNFDVRLQDRSGRSRAIRVSTFTTIPYPYERGDAIRIKSALKSIRVPLISYTITNLGADPVDLTDLDSVSFEFDSTLTGEIGITDIEFVP